MAAMEGVDVSAAGAWMRIAERAVAAGAHAVAIAGDIFDGTGAYYETRRQFLAGLEVLDRAGIPVIAVAGNHDYEALPRFARQHPLPNFHVLGLGGRWESKEIETGAGRLNFVGWSFPQERVVQSQLTLLEAQSSRLPTIGLVHGDTVPRSNYHPITAIELERGADAWILGHVHAPCQVVSKAQYPGSPQALDFGPGERGTHGFKWLSLRAKKWSFSEVEPISTVRFEEMDLSVEPAEDEDPWVAAMRTAEERLRELRETEPGLPTVQLRATVIFSGIPKPPRLTEGYEVSREGSDAILFMDARVRPASDRWKLAEGPTVIGEAARLLLGLEALSMADPDPRVKPDWLRNAANLIEQGIDDVRAQYRRTLRSISDEGDGGRPEPDEEQAHALARSALSAQLEIMLSELEGVA